MVALLKVFPSAPPVIRRRAKELLDVIRACLTSHLTKVPTASTSAPQGTEPMSMSMEGEISHPTSEANLGSPMLWTGDQRQYTFCAHSVAIPPDFASTT